MRYVIYQLPNFVSYLSSLTKLGGGGGTLDLPTLANAGYLYVTPCTIFIIVLHRRIRIMICPSRRWFTLSTSNKFWGCLGSGLIFHHRIVMDSAQSIKYRWSPYRSPKYRFPFTRASSTQPRLNPYLAPMPHSPSLVWTFENSKFKEWKYSG